MRTDELCPIGHTLRPRVTHDRAGCRRGPQHAKVQLVRETLWECRGADDVARAANVQPSPRSAGRSSTPAGKVLPPHPTGWYATCFSAEVRSGSLLTRTFMGRDLVLFRTQSGEACAADAYCPHLGAHFGHGGAVEGELLRCPFHNFRFDVRGHCVATGYGTKPPPNARVRTWPLREVNSMLLVYHDAEGRVPGWQVPELDRTGWSAPVFRRFTLSAHPQVTTENSVDLGHFSSVHGYESVSPLRDVRIDGPYLSTAYTAKRPAPLVGRRWLFDFDFETHIHGLGYSQVDVRVRGFDIRARLWVLPTPAAEGRVTLYLAASGDGASGATHPLLRVIPRQVRGALIARGLLAALVSDARQDFIIWGNGRYTHPPALAQGDGPIGKYRVWAAQFYQ
jgi:cholesterol 7-desaturase